MTTTEPETPNTSGGASGTPSGADPTAETASAVADTAGAGTYELLRSRLLEHADELGSRASRLNDQRLETFGTSRFELVGSERIRTENNCVARDIVSVGDQMLFGYNVFLGLKSETTIDDVFTLHRLDQSEESFSLSPLSEAADGSATAWLHDPSFLSDFSELTRYYKDNKLLQLRRTEGRMLAAFQIGNSVSDIRVFRWEVSPDGGARYLDNRGERDHIYPPQFGFEWIPVTRSHHVGGVEPHVNLDDRVFVYPEGGALEIRLEDNTETGSVVLAESVDNADQSVADTSMDYAIVGDLVLLRVRPYLEDHDRFYVVNLFNRSALRADAIGQSCQILPEDHGLIFPGGYYLREGDTKVFDLDTSSMEFKAERRSPNGEDVLYAFHQRSEGRTILLSYNLIRREVAPPINCHGYSIFENGTLVVFREDGEPTRVHPMQIWATPFVSDDFHARQPLGDGFLERIGNAEAVRGVSESLNIKRLVADVEPSAAVFEALSTSTVRVLDAYAWLADDAAGDLAAPLGEIRATSELIIDEFEKAESLKATALDVVTESRTEIRTLVDGLRAKRPSSTREFVDALQQLRRKQGHVLTLRDVRYVDDAALDELDGALQEAFDTQSSQAVEFLADDAAFEGFHTDVASLTSTIESTEKVTDLQPHLESLDDIGEGLDLLTEVVGGLDIDDATVRTSIFERVSDVMGSLNRTRAVAENQRRTLNDSENSAAFGVEFGLFSQSVTAELSRASTPERADAALGTLLVQLENLESRFGESDDYLDQIATKREDIYEAFSSRKQSLIDDRQRAARRLVDASDRILTSLNRRIEGFESPDEINAFFVSDPLVAKVRSIAEDLRGLDEQVRADEVLRTLETAKEESARSLRDRTDIFEDGGQVIRLGRHRFSVDSQRLELTTAVIDGELHVVITGTDFKEIVSVQALGESALGESNLDDLRPFWDQSLVSERNDFSRIEFLATSLLNDAAHGGTDLTMTALREAAGSPASLEALVRSAAEGRVDEGYDRGVHDHDAALILGVLINRWDEVALLRFEPHTRALAQVFWAHGLDEAKQAELLASGVSLGRLRSTFANSPAIADFIATLTDHIALFTAANPALAESLGVGDDLVAVATYLFEELAEEPLAFVVSSAASNLRDALLLHHDTVGSSLAELEGLSDRTRLLSAWFTAFATAQQPEALAYVPEAVALMVAADLPHQAGAVDLRCEVTGLLSQHNRITNQTLAFRYDQLLAEGDVFRRTVVPGFRAYQSQRHELLTATRHRLRLDEFTPKVMSAFVRNQLIDQVYLPFIGDNLAKQLGTIEGGRTDQMGLLLLISPPGYGKTTLMEYVANRLGMVFVKINGPALGHGVDSLDPTEAPNATAAQEVDKINFALEMGSNVLLYLDDIQHTNPELLQKFISMSDAQRRMEGVWNGRTQTYDLRGKRFAVVMAGNPYTESGERFQIPDMLANRADTYNLGDVLTGNDQQFALSYLENSLTSNPVLASLTTRDPGDTLKLIAMAKGEAVSPDDLAHPYSKVEIDELVATFRRLIRVQQVLLAVNQTYISSASQEDEFRTEPRFQLQGSYRNMNRLAEKVLPVMNDDELEALLDDHYVGEAQTLTTGAESNLLKLRELRGVLDGEDAERWEEIKNSFRRMKLMGGSDDDPMVRVAGAVSGISEQLRALSENRGPDAAEAMALFDETLRKLIKADEVSRAARQAIYRDRTSNRRTPAQSENPPPPPPPPPPAD